MADKKDNKPLLPGKPPRGNYQIWVILATIAVVFGVMYMSSNNNLKEINKIDFEQMIREKYVKKVVLIEDQKIVEITLTSDALQNAKYRQDAEKSPLSANANGPHYKMKIISVDNFDRWYTELVSKLPEGSRPEYKPET